MITDRAGHWDGRYTTVGSSGVSWFEAEPATSLELFEIAGARPVDPVIDVGGGASRLVDTLLGRGFEDVTVLDISHVALDEAHGRIGDRAGVSWMCADLLRWSPPRRWRIWHDRAVFHFLTEAGDRERYRRLLTEGVEVGGAVVIGTFATDGPETCSGLPVCRYAADELVGVIGSGFDVVTTRRSEHHTPSGALQPFTWAVLRRTR